MGQIDSTDQRLIAALRRDSRIPLSTLAADLNLARATVKARIDRLVASGTIERFTIELNSARQNNLVRAVVMIKLEGRMSRAVVRALSDLPQISRLHATNGVWDMVAEVECASLLDFDSVLRAIRDVKGVLGSDSSLLLRTVTP